MKKSLVHVTDHALVRYLERVQGVDMERLRRQIGRSVDRGATLGAGQVKVDGVVYCLNGKTVTTVVKYDLRKQGHRSRK